MCESVRQKLGHSIECVGWEIEGYIAQWGQNHYKIEFENKNPMTILFAENFLDWKHQEIYCRRCIEFPRLDWEQPVEIKFDTTFNSNCEKKWGIQKRSTVKPRLLRGFLIIFNFNYNFRTFLNPLCIKGGKIQTVKYMKFH